MSSKAKTRTALQTLPLALVDRPARPARKTFDDEAMADLMESMNDVGLIEPIVVKAGGGRYEVLAGDRRLAAARNLNWTEIDAIVRTTGATDGEAVKVHENANREELNAAEEAQHFARLLEEDCERDVDKLCALVKKNRSYVESRLLLLIGDPAVLEQLEIGEISFAAAKEINATEDPNLRKVFLESATRAGTSARQIREWRHQHDRGDTPADPQVEVSGTGQEAAPVSSPTVLHCEVCHDPTITFGLEVFYIHVQCKRLIFDRLANVMRDQLGIVNAKGDGR